MHSEMGLKFEKMYLFLPFSPNSTIAAKSLSQLHWTAGREGFATILRWIEGIDLNQTVAGPWDSFKTILDVSTPFPLC